MGGRSGVARAASATRSTPSSQPPGYGVFSHCDLAYATTVHAVQGRTVEVGHAFVDGLGSRQWLYVAMSCGSQANYAYCLTGYPGYADGPGHA